MNMTSLALFDPSLAAQFGPAIRGRAFAGASVHRTLAFYPAHHLGKDE